ncbi:PREDICTED: acid phosphatase 1 [Camelina sativa]|uniref:Acid phosphatase 1 n=1 Tax=Camelina sativa TaxID=90675 RepID=A0ABM0UAI2_CAMSA|nr:PREDICTED: acid phosphatase 1 [Camelina sativa]
MTFSRSRSVSFFILALFAVLINPAISSRASSLIKLPNSDETPDESPSESQVIAHCAAWRLAVETDNAGKWKVVPRGCVVYVKNYYSSGQFDADYDVLVVYITNYAKTIKLAGNGKDAWVFDIDETLLSNFPYYKAHGYGSEPYDNTQFNRWVVTGKAQAFDASLRLYNVLKELGFTIILLTGRDESQRSITEKNLLYAGYSGWNRLLLRGHEDQGKAATQYKSEQRAKVLKEGYTIHGSTGDQWSDLQGFALAARSFKVPNPLYYIA